MHLARWVTKATDAHLRYATLITFSRQQWLRERASMLCLYTQPPLVFNANG